MLISLSQCLLLLLRALYACNWCSSFVDYKAFTHPNKHTAVRALIVCLRLSFK